MTLSRARRLWLVMLAALLVLLLSPPVHPQTAAGERPPAAILTPGRLVVDWIDQFSNQPGSELRLDRPTDIEVAAALEAGTVGNQPLLTATAVGGFTACFDEAVPTSVRAAVERSLEVWDQQLLLDGPAIELDVYWTPFPAAAALGASGPSRFVQDGQLPRPEIRYPVSLANQLTGNDYSPRKQCDRSADGEAVLYLNSSAGGDGTLWHLDTSSPPADKIDLESVVTHELAHSLGHLSSALIDADGVQRWPFDFGAPYLYDTFFRRCATANDCTFATTTPVDVSSQASLTTGDLWFGVPNTNPLQLHAPEQWATGSSISHLDEERYNRSGPFALMSPYMARGEEHNDLDNATLAMMQSLGWPLTDLAAAPANVTASAGDGQARIGFSRPNLAAAPPAVDYVVTLWTDGTVEQTVTVPGSPVVLRGLVNGRTYQFSVRARTAAGLSAPSDLSPEVTPLELPPFATAETFVEQSFQQLFGRSPTINEQAVWTKRTRASANVVSILSQLADEPEVEQQRRIARLYLGFFNRQPDAGGLSYWIDRAGSGETLERIALQFARASEFEQGAAVSDQEFVTATYQRVLGRNPDRGGLAYWTSQLKAGLDRGRLLLLFSESPEHVATSGANSEIIVLSRALLGRSPTADELEAWLDVVDRRGRGPYLEHLVGSQEYVVRVGP